MLFQNYFEDLLTDHHSSNVEIILQLCWSTKIGKGCLD